MSCKVLVIPEDPTFNGYLLKPLVERIMEGTGRPRAKVLVLRDPKSGGFEHAWELLSSGTLKMRYGHFDLWLFLPDGDKAKDLSVLEKAVFGQRAPLIACYLTPEVEVTVIAGHSGFNTHGWRAKKKHPSFKEAIFEPFLKDHGNPKAPGCGREKLMLEALQNYDRMKQLVPELAMIEQRVASALNPAS